MQTHYKHVVPMTPEPVEHLHQPPAAADEGVVLTCYSYHWNNGGKTIEPENCW